MREQWVQGSEFLIKKIELTNLLKKIRRARVYTCNLFISIQVKGKKERLWYVAGLSVEQLRVHGSRRSTCS